MFKILKKEYLANNIWLMDVEAPRVAKSCQPADGHGVAVHGELQRGRCDQSAGAGAGCGGAVILSSVQDQQILLGKNHIVLCGIGCNVAALRYGVCVVCSKGRAGQQANARQQNGNHRMDPFFHFGTPLSFFVPKRTVQGVVPTTALYLAGTVDVCRNMR